MTNEEFVTYIFDKTVEIYSSLPDRDSFSLTEAKDEFDRTYRFLEQRLINHLTDAGCDAPVKSPLD